MKKYAIMFGKLIYMKKIVKTEIKSNNEIKHYKSKAIKANNRLKYREDDTIVVLDINDAYLTLRRENKECSYTFIFNKNKSILEFSLNANNYKFSMEFKTKKITIEEKIIEVIYILEDIEYTYKVNIEEDL